MRGRFVLISLLVCTSCQKSEHHNAKPVPPAKTGSGSAGVKLPEHPVARQVKPPFDLKDPPADAVKKPSGLIYKKIVSNPSGAVAKRNDTVMIKYTGWRQATGQTFFTNQAHGKPMPLDLTDAAPGFTEAMEQLHKGETAVLWLPPEIGYKHTPPHGAQTLVYEVEVVDIKPAPAVPADVAKPPAAARTTRTGIKYEVVKPGSGTTKAHSYDHVRFTYTGWTPDGRMFDTTEMKRKHPPTVTPYKQPGAFEDVLTNMVSGERVRFWVNAKKLKKTGKPPPGTPAGQLCYEVEVMSITPGIEPPKTPRDVARPPPGARKTAKGVFYKVLKHGKGGPHPKPSDSVRVNYTGWTTDGKMFDSSVTRGRPATFSLRGVIAGWTDGIPLMSVGDKFRFWIPEKLAYKGAPGKPQGMLVFDVQLLAINPHRPGMPHGMPPHGMPPHGMPHRMPPHGMPPHGMPHRMPPHMPPHRMPPHMPPHPGMAPHHP